MPEPIEDEEYGYADRRESKGAGKHKRQKPRQVQDLDGDDLEFTEQQHMFDEYLPEGLEMQNRGGGAKLMDKQKPPRSQSHYSRALP